MAMSGQQNNHKIPVFIGIGIVAILVPLVWVLMRANTVESLISCYPFKINDTYTIVKLSERTNQMRNRRTEDYVEEVKHFGYSLELVDSASGRSLCKKDFDPPVFNIEGVPTLVVQNDGDIWVIGTTNSRDRDKKGFVLKFKMNGNFIEETNFKMNEDYWACQVKDSWILLGDGTSSSGGYSPAFGGIYFDLDSEKIVDDRKKNN